MVAEGFSRDGLNRVYVATDNRGTAEVQIQSIGGSGYAHIVAPPGVPSRVRSGVYLAARPGLLEQQWVACDLTIVLD